MLAVLLAGQFMALLDVTIVNVAMPTIGRTLHATGTELQLIVSGYTVSYAMLLITGARLGDAAGGRRNLFVGGRGGLHAGLRGGVRVRAQRGRAHRGPVHPGCGGRGHHAADHEHDPGPVRRPGPGAGALSAYSAVLASGFVAGQVVGGLLVNANLSGQPVAAGVPGQRADRAGRAVRWGAPRFIPRDERAGGCWAGPGGWGWG